MESTGIVSTFNKFLTDKAVIVLQKVKKPSCINAFKEYVWTVWYVVKGKKYQLSYLDYTAREVTEAEESRNIKVMEDKLLAKLFNIASDYELLKLLRNGEFTGCNNQDQ